MIKSCPFALLSALVFSASFVFAEPAFTVSSDDMHPGKSLSINQVANGFGCQGKNQSPAIAWSNPPASTRSFAITVYDPDAPTGSGWWHWVVFNIPASVSNLSANASVSALPVGAIQTRNDTGNTGFFGACPPEGHGPHHYQLTIYALNVDSLPLTVDATPAMVGFYLHAHAIATSTIEAVYQR